MYSSFTFHKTSIDLQLLLMLLHGRMFGITRTIPLVGLSITSAKVLIFV